GPRPPGAPSCLGARARARTRRRRLRPAHRALRQRVLRRSRRSGAPRHRRAATARSRRRVVAAGWLALAGGARVIFPLLAAGFFTAVTLVAALLLGALLW